MSGFYFALLASGAFLWVVDMPRKIDLAGQRFGRLLVLNESRGRDRSGSVQWNCMCDCGTETVTAAQALRSGHTSSCGCLRLDRLRGALVKHDACGTAAYVSWSAMMHRCNNKKAINYEDYGGRGISVCERWHDFNNFLADMGEPSYGESIDRIDNNGIYEPGNCRWADRRMQQRNTRRQENPNVGVELLKHGRFRARIECNGRKIDLGTHATIEQARAARRRGEQIYWGI